MARFRQILLILRREPLAKFLLLGLVVFAGDRLLSGASGDNDAARIVVTASQQTALRDAFRAEHGRAPAAAELQARLDRWIEEQVLYREALALGLDRKDLIVHRQLTQKMRFLLENTISPANPSAGQLQAWLEQYPQRYGHQPTFSFEQVFLSRGRHGAALREEAARIGAQLASLPSEFAGLGDAFLTGQVVTDADPVRLRREFGPGFARALQAMPEQTWSGPALSSFGLHFVRVTRRTPFRPASLNEVAERVRLDYQTAQRERFSQQALDRLRQRYKVEIEGAAG